METGFGAILQKVIVFGSIIGFVVIFGPHLNEARKVYQVQKEADLNKAAFASSKEAVTFIRDKLKLKGVELAPDNISASGSRDNMDITIEFDQLVKVNKVYEIEISWSFPLKSAE